MQDGPAVRIYCLGHFRVENERGSSIARQGQPKPFALLKLLITLGGRHVPQDAALDALWTDSDGDAAQTAFATTLYRLRQVVGQNAVILRNRQLSLDPELVWWDVAEFESIVEKVLSNSELERTTCAALAERLITLYRGPFLAGESDPPAILALRERLRSRFLRSVREITAAMQASGDNDSAITFMEKSLEIVPNAEDLCQSLMTAFASAGRTAEALAAYEQLRRVLDAETSTLPSVSTESVRKDVEALAVNGRSAGGIIAGSYAPEHIPRTLEGVTPEAVAEPFREAASLYGLRIKARSGILGVLAFLVAAVVGVALWQNDGSRIQSLPPADAEGFPAVPDGPSLVVLPFSNMSADPQQGYIADGLTDTLITDLSRLHRILVIARHSAFTYKGRAVDAREVGRAFGVRHILEGSVQLTGSRLRVNVQLIEAATGAHLWANRFDRPFEDIFQVQDEITNRVVEELDVKLVTGEQARSWRRMTKNAAAYSEVLAGRAIQAKEHTVDSQLRSREHFRRAIELDPEFAFPWAYMVSVYMHLTDSGYNAEPAISYRTALQYADRAVELNPDLPIARAYRGAVLQQLARYDEAAKEYSLAVQNGPNAAESLMLSAWGIAAVGDPNTALPLAMRAFRLDPVPPGWYWGGIADIFLGLQRWQEAVPAYERCLVESLDLIWCRAGLTASYARAGRLEDARRAAREWRQIDPSVKAQKNFYLLAWRDPQFRLTLSRSFAEAGL